MQSRVYLDHNALSPLRPEVVEIINKFTSDPTFNPSSIHGAGRKTRRKIDDARETVAKIIGANPSEIIFTSGGTESVHVAWNAFAQKGQRLATTTVEHSCVLSAADRAGKNGAAVTRLNVQSDASLNETELEKVLAQGLDFLSIQHANNETGVIYPVEKWSRAARLKHVVTHTDAVQSLGKTAVDVHNLGIDLLSISGHKLGAPSGIGALYVRKGTPLAPLWEGGPQEKGRRTGTENVLGILCLAEACRMIRENGTTEHSRLEKLRNEFESELIAKIGSAEITSRNLPRLCNTTHIIFDGVDGESLLIAADLEGIDCSTGAACSSGSLKPSHVLLAMGTPILKAHGSIRFSLGWSTTEADMERALATLPKLVAQVRNAGQNYTRKKAL